MSSSLELSFPRPFGESDLRNPVVKRMEGMVERLIERSGRLSIENAELRSKLIDEAAVPVAVERPMPMPMRESEPRRRMSPLEEIFD